MLVCGVNCTVYSTAEFYRLKEIAKHFSGHAVHMYENDVLAITSYEGGDVFFTFFGCVVFWNIPTQVQARILEHIRPCSKEMFNTIEVEELSLECNPECTEETIDGDVIRIPHKNQKTLLVLSYALAQATRLNGFERTLEALVRETKQLPEDLATQGKSNISQKDLGQILGRTFLLSNSMNLQSDIWDTPDLLWSEDNEHIHTYEVIREKMEIDKRAHLIDKRIIIIQNVCSMLHDHFYHQRSLRLEIAIVILIAIETFGFFAHHAF